MTEDKNYNVPKSSTSQNCNLPERDHFELLSAYLDGEVTPQERQQVQIWLENKPQTQKLYQRLLKLRGEFQSLDQSFSPCSHQDLSDQVFCKINRQNRRQKRLLIASATLAAGLVATVSGLFTITPALKLAESNSPSSNSDLLKVAVNRPAVEIPANMDFSIVDDLESWQNK